MNLLTSMDLKGMIVPGCDSIHGDKQAAFHMLFNFYHGVGLFFFLQVIMSVYFVSLQNICIHEYILYYKFIIL